MLDPGLCKTCTHADPLKHPRGGDPYWRCAKAAIDPSYPKYPRLPVMACRGYEKTG
jgi:hypothetical protein